MKTFTRILQSLGIVAGAMLFGAGIAFATNITVPSAPAAGYTLVSTSTGAYITVAASSTTNVYIDSNRVDSYTADGSILKPYKTITAANSAVSAATSITLAAYHIAPGTYAEQSMTLPNIPLVIYGQGATIILLSGPNLGAGLMTIPNDISFYDPVIFGNVSETDTSQTNPHTFTNGFIAGNFNVKGNATFTGGAIVDQNTLAFPFLSQSASSTLIVQPNSITNFNGDNIQVVIQDNGTINLNDDNLQVSTSTAYALTATTTDSAVNINGLSLENFGTGGGINIQNGATNSLPNEISSASLTLGVGTTNAINAGTAVSYIGPYTAFTLNGTRLFASGAGLSPLSFATLDVEGNVGIGTTTPFAPLSITGTNGNSVPVFYIATSTNTTFPFGFEVDSAGNSYVADSLIFYPADNSGGAFGSHARISSNTSGKLILTDSGGFVAVTASSLQFGASGAGLFGNNAGQVAGFNDNFGNVGNYYNFADSALGGTPVLSTAGHDTNVSMDLAPKGTGNVGIGTTTPDSTLDVNGTVRFEGTSSFITASISGSITGIGCDTSDTTGLTGLASTTAFVTTPESFPGNGVFSYTMALTPTSARTYVCSDVSLTPNASTYAVKIIR